MMDAPPSPSATLQPPRKSIELEDPGAHDLETSENEDDVFSDAQEGRASSGANSPIPTTRVEKVDDHESYGEVPGTAAYNLRAQDAVPDELEIIPEGEGRKSPSQASGQNKPSASAGIAIPKTVVQKISPESPGYGDIPGTAAHSIRMADAVPDAIVQVPDPCDKLNPSPSQKNTLNETNIPKTVITKIDSAPSHGEVPGTAAFDKRKGDAEPDAIEKKGDIPSKPELFDQTLSSERLTESGLPTFFVNRSANSKTRQREPSIKGNSSIAADGGFGPMSDEDSENEINDPGANLNSHPGVDEMEDFGEDFDDFEAGAIDEEFGDFDEGFQEPSVSENHESELQKPTNSGQAPSPSAFPFPLLDFSGLDTLDDLITASKPYLDELFPSTKTPFPPQSSPVLEKPSIFLTDRSLSLWSQLVAPPPLQPPNWVRSRIRRLFLVSLGVPVDLDEILPASKQKKLILPSTKLRSGSNSPSEGRRHGSRIRLKQENASSASLDQSSTSKPSRKRKGPPPPPELDLGAIRMLCTSTEAALSNFLDEELQVHIKKLEELTMNASEALEYWLKRKDNALGDKEAFEGVIENLVKHARRVRK